MTVVRFGGGNACALLGGAMRAGSGVHWVELTLLELSDEHSVLPPAATQGAAAATLLVWYKVIRDTSE